MFRNRRDALGGSRTAISTRDAHSTPLRAGSVLPEPALRFREIGLIDFEPDKFFHAAALRRDG